jgi:hypothetical protein
MRDPALRLGLFGLATPTIEVASRHVAETPGRDGGFVVIYTIAASMR